MSKLTKVFWVSVPKSWCTELKYTIVNIIVTCYINVNIIYTRAGSNNYNVFREQELQYTCLGVSVIFM